MCLGYNLLVLIRVLLWQFPLIIFSDNCFFSLHGFLSWCVGLYICINLLNPFMKSFHLKKYPSFEYNLHLDPFKDTHFYTVLTWRFRWSVFRFCRRYLQHTPGPPPMWRRSLWGWIQGECPGGPSQTALTFPQKPLGNTQQNNKVHATTLKVISCYFFRKCSIKYTILQDLFSNNTGYWDELISFHSLRKLLYSESANI